MEVFGDAIFDMYLYKELVGVISLGYSFQSTIICLAFACLVQLEPCREARP
jgi:hypothetical protein